jgi:mRNA-degrading endonuclease RelE of RelBE toxin-antitoxin system
MKTKLVIETQVLEFIRRQPPETRRHLRAALHEIERGETFPEPLDDELEGFYKVKVDDCRFILKSEPGDTAPLFKVAFAERRKVVYEMFRQIAGLE